MRLRASLRPDPWSTDGWEEIEVALPPDASLAQAVQAALGEDLPIDEARNVILAEIDGRPVPAEIWTATPAPRDRALALTALPRGGGFRPIAQIALIVASLVVGNPYLAAAILIGGNLLLNELFPVETPSFRTPQPSDPASPERFVAAAAGNRLRPYGRRTLVLGDMRWTPDLLTRQLLVPTLHTEADEGAGTPESTTDHRVVVPGAAAASLGVRLDRVMFLDLGIGALSVAHPDGADIVLAAGRRETRAEKLVEADSTAIAPEYVVTPGGALAPPAGLRPSAGWPLRARAVVEKADALSGAEVAIDRSRSASRLLVVLGGPLYDSESNGKVVEESTDLRFVGAAPGEADVDQTVRISNDTLSTEYIAVELAGGARDWTITGGERSLSARSRKELSVFGSYWLAPLSDLTGRKLPSNVYAVRIEGQVGAPARRVLRVRARQTVPVPGASGVWSATRHPSRNPAAILRAFALGWYEDGLLVAGTGRHRDTVDHANLARFHRRCEEHDPPLRCDLLLQDDRRPAEQIERLIAATGRAEISWATGRLGVVWAEPDEAPVGLIAHAQVLPGSLRLAWRGTAAPDVIVASYFDREAWDSREVRVTLPGVAAEVREREIQIEGVTDAAAARFHTAAAAAEEAYHRRAISWRAGREGALMIRGSLWLMAADLLSGGLAGRLREFGESRVRLDRPVRLGSRPWIALDAPGAGLHRTAVLPAAADPAGGETDALILVQPMPGFGAADAAQPRDTVWRLYDYARPPKPVRILSNRPVSETEFDIVARDERPEFWEFLDTYRKAPTARPRIDLPEHVEITADGAWNWPQAWTDLGIVDASLVLRGAGGGERGGTGFWPANPNDKSSSDSWTHGGAGANAQDTTATLADGTVVTARGGAGGGHRFRDHNALGEAGGSILPYERRGWHRRPAHGGDNGQAGELVSRPIVAADAPLRIDLGAGGRGGSGGSGGRGGSSGRRGGNGTDAVALIYPLPP